MTQSAPLSAFDTFRARLGSDDIAKNLHSGLIGKNTMIDGPCGPKPLIYADYVASGRALRQVEEFVLEDLLPYYANSHTEASFVGGTMTRLRREARTIIRALCHAGEEHAVIFTGSGATAGINRLVHLLGLKQAILEDDTPVVLIGPYEHHSNILPWRECGAEVIEIPETDCGGPCLETLDRLLSEHQGRMVVGAFSAASNVTGILTNVTEVTRRLKAGGALAVWDYAGGAPYLPINMTPAEDAAIDAVVVSPHKFVGGPQASGVMLIRKDAIFETIPTLPGGGTVRFVSPSGHDYSPNVEAREEGGTPNVIGDIRAALAFIVKDTFGQSAIDRQNARFCQMAFEAWGQDPNIEILGHSECQRLPIFSFRIRDGAGGYVHQQLFTRMLSDRKGIQARGGCACAGPYVHKLLNIDETKSEELRQEILSGNEVEKPGFVRLNFSYLMTDEEVRMIIDAVSDLAAQAAGLSSDYSCNHSTAIFSPV